MNPAELEAAHGRATAEVRKRVLDYVTAVWGQASGFRDADVDRIVARLVPTIQAGMMQIANLTNAYIGQQAVLAGVTWTSGVDRAAILNYRGTPADEVYRRPAKTVYKALAQDQTFAEAVAQGLGRLVSLVATDMQQAKTRQAQASLSRSGFEYYLRVLTGAENCALCAIASTQRYHRGDLMPIHPECDCGIRTIKSSRDPGQVIDAKTLQMVHDQVEARTGRADRGGRKIGLDNPVADYLDLIVTNQHGELGPTLGWRDQKFTGPNDLTSH